MEHFYQNIHGWMDYQDLYTMMVNQAPDPAHFVEVGSWKGCSAAYMAVEIINSQKNIQLDCVDTWLGSPEHQAGGQFQDADCIAGQLFEKFQENMAPVAHVVSAKRGESLMVVEEYQDASLDFVFIDANHTYEHVKADILAWLPKIKSGGYLAGHDYTWPGPRQAVDELFAATRTLIGPSSWLVQVP